MENEILKLIESYKRDNSEITKELNECSSQLRYSVLVERYNTINQFIEDLQILQIMSKHKK